MQRTIEQLLVVSRERKMLRRMLLQFVRDNRDKLGSPEIADKVRRGCLKDLGDGRLARVALDIDTQGDVRKRSHFVISLLQTLEKR